MLIVAPTAHADIVKENTVPMPTTGQVFVMGSLPSLRQPSGPAGGRGKEEREKKGKGGGMPADIAFQSRLTVISRVELETKAHSEVSDEAEREQDGETSSATLSGTHDGSRDVNVKVSAPSRPPARPASTTNGAKIDDGEAKGNFGCLMRLSSGMLIVGPYTKVTREGSLTDNHVDGRKQDENTLSATPCVSAKGAGPIVVKIPVQRDRERQAGTASIRTQREAEPGE
jgi:hypothetical protein